MGKLRFQSERFELLDEYAVNKDDFGPVGYDQYGCNVNYIECVFYDRFTGVVYLKPRIRDIGFVPILKADGKPMLKDEYLAEKKKTKKEPQYVVHEKLDASYYPRVGYGAPENWLHVAGKPYLIVAFPTQKQPEWKFYSESHDSDYDTIHRDITDTVSKGAAEIIKRNVRLINPPGFVDIA